MENDTPISVALTNLGKYTEGCLAFKWLNLPATTEQVQDTFREIGVDGIRYEEWFLSDYESSVDGLHEHLSEYANLDELNYLATLIEEMDPGQRDIFEAALAYGEYTNSTHDLINLAQNLEKFDLYPSVHSEEDYGYYLVDEMGSIEIPDHLRNYFDYEAYGRDCMLEETGMQTDSGYIRDTGLSFTEYYDGEVPEEYKITAYPKPRSIEQMERGTSSRATKPTPEPSR